MIKLIITIFIFSHHLFGIIPLEQTKDIDSLFTKADELGAKYIVCFYRQGILRRS